MAVGMTTAVIADTAMGRGPRPGSSRGRGPRARGRRAPTTGGGGASAPPEPVARPGPQRRVGGRGGRGRRRKGAAVGRGGGCGLAGVADSGGGGAGSGDDGARAARHRPRDPARPRRPGAAVPAPAARPVGVRRLADPRRRHRPGGVPGGDGGAGAGRGDRPPVHPRRAGRGGRRRLRALVGGRRGLYDGQLVLRRPRRVRRGGPVRDGGRRARRRARGPLVEPCGAARGRRTVFPVGLADLAVRLAAGDRPAEPLRLPWV